VVSCKQALTIAAGRRTSAAIPLVSENP